MMRAQCSGSRWIEDTAGTFRPCPRCNPFLSWLHEDRDRWADWHAGRPLPAAPDWCHTPAAPCRQGFDPWRPPFSAGAALAVAAYLEECDRLGKTPSDATLAGITGGDV